MMLAAMTALLSLPRVISTRLSSSLMTVTRNLGSISRAHWSAHMMLAAMTALLSLPRIFSH